MTTDRQLQERVLSALDFEPSIDAALIGVSVDNGVITLRGSVKTFHEKWGAERMARGLAGVRAIANELTVLPSGSLARTDSAIAEAAANVLSWNTVVPLNAVRVSVSNGFVTLTGSVSWQYQRAAAAKAIRTLPGVKGVIDLIDLTPRVNVGDLKAKIEDAFKRSAEVDAARVRVEARDGEVILSGTVRSLSERSAAERAVWAAPGVSKIDDRLVVTP
jgi:osmotically-inducible protein OsmY